MNRRFRIVWIFSDFEFQRFNVSSESLEVTLLHSKPASWSFAAMNGTEIWALRTTTAFIWSSHKARKLASRNLRLVSNRNRPISLFAFESGPHFIQQIAADQRHVYQTFALRVVQSLNQIVSTNCLPTWEWIRYERLWLFVINRNNRSLWILICWWKLSIGFDWKLFCV